MRYRERLVAPLWWWLVAAGFVAGMTTSVWAFLGPAFGIGSALVFCGTAAALLTGYGWAWLAVDRDGVDVSGARLEWAWLGEVSALDEQTTARLLSRECDPRAYLVTRPYIKTAVRIEVCDDADPHPYWLVSSRRPDEAVAAIEASRKGAGRDRGRLDADE
ncbi:MAG: DUF3093 domain-containing protein [Propionibacteriaceae bacterium]|nr:DUF3093 domain-containing protein [Propionibacteriaceae bacterium]